MKKLIFVPLVATLALVAFGGGTVVKTGPAGRTMKKVSLAWTITTNENVSATVQGVSGELLRFVIPAGLETNEITITIKDSNGVDLLAGLGTTISNVLIHSWESSTNFPIASDGDLTISVTNSTMGVGATTNGTIDFYYR